MKKAQTAILIGVAALVLSVPVWVLLLLPFVFSVIGDRSERPPTYDIYAPTGSKVKFTMQNGKSFAITTGSEWSPKSVKHFINLVQSGSYDGKPLYRVATWVVRWGPSLKNPDSAQGGISDSASGYDGHFNKYDAAWNPGWVGMASDGSNGSGDSQPFILKSASSLYEPYLVLGHVTAVVGKVTEGMDVVDGIKKGDKVRTARVIK
ncbi:MAG TPA: peptidylprolyl isomerase [Fimbriimonadaceae bacterium]|jgi:peptidyl-prolyl cis-trans isomerase B (cyclophilin B)